MAKRRDHGGGPDPDIDGDLMSPDWQDWQDEDGQGGASPAVPAAPGSELDLHTFQPKECGDVVTEYLHTAHGAGLRHVRIIHGKGIGSLRRTVHAVLERHPAVRAYRLADERAGSWGATLVELVD